MKGEAAYSGKTGTVKTLMMPDDSRTWGGMAIIPKQTTIEVLGGRRNDEKLEAEFKDSLPSQKRTGTNLHLLITMTGSRGRKTSNSASEKDSCRSHLDQIRNLYKTKTIFLKESLERNPAAF